jgi:hypothetical protein
MLYSFTEANFEIPSSEKIYRVKTERGGNHSLPRANKARVNAVEHACRVGIVDSIQKVTK